MTSAILTIATALAFSAAAATPAHALGNVLERCKDKQMLNRAGVLVMRTCRLPPHIAAQIADLRANRRVVPAAVDAIVAALRVDMSLPDAERARRWHVALGELDNAMRTVSINESTDGGSPVE